ncbi:MAG: phage head morphogenesis protein [Clostridia bacterium]|nr:phage head morphogenesis protein [Clostridia bacterium]
MIIVFGNSNLNPMVTQSINWKCWYAKLSLATCKDCRDLNLRIFDMYEPLRHPMHPNCRCSLVPLGAIYNGTATSDGLSGADVWLKMYGELPGNYVDKDYAKEHGWKSIKGNLREVLPGATMGGNIYYNNEHILPEKPGRIWHEADINYDGGFRNTHRLLYSNDGLVFVTYDHYQTFYEII